MEQSPTSLAQSFYTVIVALILGLVFNYFFFLKVPGISFLLYVGLILVGLRFLATLNRHRLTKSSVILVIPLLFFSAMLAVRSSPVLSFFNVLASLILLLLIVTSTRGRKLTDYRFLDYLRLVYLPFSFLLPAVSTLTNLIPRSAQPNHLRQIIKGALITLPVLLVFVLLFASADLVFAKYLSQLFSFNLHLDPLFTFRAIMVLTVAFAFTGAYAYIFKPASEDQASAITPTRRLGPVEANILLGSVGVLFLVFILVQLTYLFGGQANITALGFTYAQYARKGFFELVTVAIIAFVLIWAVQKQLIKPNLQHSSGFKLLGSLLIGEVLVILASAFMRLLLYEQAYGFTELRFYSHVFIVLLGIIYLLLLYQVVTNGTEKALVFKSAVSATAVLVFLNLFNPDAFTARQNIQHFAASGKLDTYHLSTLSDDALPETIKALDLPNQNLRQSFARDLYLNRVTRQNSQLYNQWPSANLSKNKAEQILNSRRIELEQNKNYLSPDSL